MTFNTAIRIARQAIVTNGVELIETLGNGTRYTTPVPAGQAPRLALANARRSLAERMVERAAEEVRRAGHG